MEEIKENLRIFGAGETLKLRKVNYILYARLQQISYRNPEESHRYINWVMLNKTEFCKSMKLPRKYLNPRLKELEKANLINIVWENEEQGHINYIVLNSEFDYYALIDLDLKFFRLMLEFTTDICWRVYICHLCESRRVRDKFGKREYYITREEIAERIGYSKDNLEKITRCNQFLKDIGRIDYSLDKTECTKGANRYKVLK